jgi:hypothetical protein
VRQSKLLVRRTGTVTITTAQFLQARHEMCQRVQLLHRVQSEQVCVAGGS